MFDFVVNYPVDPFNNPVTVITTSLVFVHQPFALVPDPLLLIDLVTGMQILYVQK